MTPMEAFYYKQLEEEVLGFLTYLEENYYYSDGGWVDKESNDSKSRSEIFKEYLKTVNNEKQEK